MIPVKWKLRPPLEHLMLLMPVSQKAKKRVSILAQVIDSDNHGKMGIITQ